MDKDKEKINKTSGGSGLGFGTEIILFMVILFIIWVLTGGSKNTINDEIYSDPSRIENPTNR